MSKELSREVYFGDTTRRIDFLSTEQKFELVMDSQEQNLIFSTPEMQARLAAEWEWEWDLIECYVVGNS